MAITRREMLKQLDELIEAEDRVMSTTSAFTQPVVDIEGFTEEAEEGEPSRPGQPPPSRSPFVESSLRR